MTDEGIIIDVNDEQFKNTFSLIVVREEGTSNDT